MTTKPFNGTVYRIANRVNGKQYVGQTRQVLNSRWTKHKYDAKTNKLSGALQHALRKYGFDNFCLSPLHSNIETLSELNRLEKYYIQELNTFGTSGYNMTTGGEGFTVSTETKLKHSQNRGWKHSEESKELMREATKGFKHSSASKKKISLALVGNKYSDPEIFKKINKDRTDTTVHAFIHEQHGKVVSNCSMLAKCFGLSNSAVHSVVRGSYKSTKGWKLYE